jgi:hypothetical protein
MLLPVVLARMKKSDDNARCGVNTREICALVQIAPMAR